MSLVRNGWETLSLYAFWRQGFSEACPEPSGLYLEDNKLNNMTLTEYLRMVGRPGAPLKSEIKLFGIDNKKGWAVRYGDMVLADDMVDIASGKNNARNLRRAGKKKTGKPFKKHIYAKKDAACFESSDEFLQSYEWRRLRMVVLKRDGAKCACCGATPATGAVMNVDHIKPRKTHPELALDAGNLQVLCHDCNHGKGNWDQTDWRK